MLFHTEQQLRSSETDLQGDEQGSTRSSACLDAQARAPSLAAPASACSSIPPPRTCLGAPAQPPSCSCSSVCLDAQAQVPSSTVPASVYLSIPPPRTWLGVSALSPSCSYLPACP